MTVQQAPATAFKEWLTRTKTGVKELLQLPVTTYYLILFAVVLLVGVGLIMVLSASSISAYDGGAGNSFSVFVRQAAFAVAGLVLMWILSFVKVDTWKRYAFAIFIVTLLFQVLPLTPLGVSVNGNRSWIQLTSSFRVQPAEFVKISLALYVAAFMSNRVRELGQLSKLLPILGFSAAAIGLVVAGHDVGTALILFAVGFGALFVGGLPWKWLLTLLALGAAGVSAMVFTSANRMARVQALLTGHNSDAADVLGTSWQSNHGLYALASGGWFGVGLGASREKWSWLPEAHNDFIFAIIGEELGLLGTAAVVLLFGVLGYGITRLVVRSQDRFVQAASAGIFGWLIGQAAINIAVVTGVLPVIGVPLPFVSYGGSSLLATLAATGILLSFARCENGAREAMRARARSFRSSLSIVTRTPSRKD